MKILQVLTYYRPHVSGLTIYVERLSRALAEQGHEVTVLTSRYERDLPRHETMDGVRVERIPVAFRVSKGVIMPAFGHHATRLTRWADAIHLHLPQFDAPGLALRGRLFGKPVVLTYHCDLQMPRGLFNRLVNQVVLAMNRLAGNLADAVVTYTADYGSHSPFLSRYLGEKLHIIAPPVELATCPLDSVAAFRAAHNLAGKKVIGISARLATEKGVEVLLRALPLVLERHPESVVLHAGPYKDIVGEEAYAARLQPLFEKYKDHYQLLGTLHGAELTAFYRNLDVLVVSSLNSTESFGLVQIEAMINGVPVVASNLPGVRQPVTMTGMGEIFPIGDHEALATALNRVLDEQERYRRPRDVIAASFDPEQTARAYVQLFEQLRQGNPPRDALEPEAYSRLRALDEEKQGG
ncbi:MAG: glycosyltransferase family 4 protein [Anaerolineae bacterium]|nr:glycosyltransferase family 4 protein [Anaerolineae bacterium]